MLNSTILSAGKMCEVSFLAEQGLWEVLMLPRKRCEELLATLKQLGGEITGIVNGERSIADDEKIKIHTNVNNLNGGDARSFRLTVAFRAEI